MTERMKPCRSRACSKFEVNAVHIVGKIKRLD